MKAEKVEALRILELCFSKKEIEIDFVLKDDDWKEFLDDVDFINIINKYK